MAEKTQGTSADKSADAIALKVVADALHGLRFGTVKLIVQDGVLIRVERTENRLVTRGQA